MTSNLASRQCPPRLRLSRPSGRPATKPATLVAACGNTRGARLCWDSMRGGTGRETRPLPDLATISRFMSRDQYAQAEPALREHLRRSPHDGERPDDAREGLRRSWQPPELRPCSYTRCPTGGRRNAEALYREGQSYLMIDRARDAEHAWLEVIKDDPLHPVSPEVFHDACQELLKLYATQDRWEDAYPVIWTAYDRAPAPEKSDLADHADARRARASRAQGIGRATEALCRRRARRLGIASALARAELALGDRALAQRHFKACLKGRPDDVRAWRDYLAMLLEHGELERFLELLGTPPPSADSEPETWFFRGVAGEKSGDWKTAAATSARRSSSTPSLPKAITGWLRPRNASAYGTRQ